jgi:uncharacterized protein
LAQWLVDEAHAIGIGGATLIAASEGYGHDHRIHSERFVELVDQPLQVVMVVTADEAERLFVRLEAEAVRVFYSRMAIEFGMTSEMDRAMEASAPGRNSVPGYQLTFFTVQDRVHRGRPLAHWLLEEARGMGIRGATLIPASEGFGHDGRVHAMHLFKMSEQPLQVIMVVSDDEVSRLFAKLEDEQVRVFYSKIRVEFGTTGGGA